LKNSPSGNDFSMHKLDLLFSQAVELIDKLDDLAFQFVGVVALPFGFEDLVKNLLSINFLYK